ncbi:hypothetical protein FIM08_02035 [SAR202 cluster bacterium AC-647-N09_OGT_505m]|nr:hypothetical protein [SAR202 cluster bacterium AC-647-N09_OGT_505m]
MYCPIFTTISIKKMAFGDSRKKQPLPGVIQGRMHYPQTFQNRKDLPFLQESIGHYIDCAEKEWECGLL